jgi:hypothetical protein
MIEAVKPNRCLRPMTVRRRSRRRASDQAAAYAGGPQPREGRWCGPRSSRRSVSLSIAPDCTEARESGPHFRVEIDQEGDEGRAKSGAAKTAGEAWLRSVAGEG